SPSGAPMGAFSSGRGVRCSERAELAQISSPRGCRSSHSRSALASTVDLRWLGRGGETGRRNGVQTCDGTCCSASTSRRHQRREEMRTGRFVQVEEALNYQPPYIGASVASFTRGG